jgi:hypothetical protein
MKIEEENGLDCRRLGVVLWVELRITHCLDYFVRGINLIKPMVCSMVSGFHMLKRLKIFKIVKAVNMKYWV